MMKTVTVLAKVGLLIWGLFCALQGAGLSMFIGPSAHSESSTFIGLLYLSVLITALISFFSEGLAAGVALLASLTCVLMVFATHAFGHDETVRHSLIVAIVLRPVLAFTVCVLLLVAVRSTVRVRQT